MGKPLSSHRLAHNEGGTAHSGAGGKKRKKASEKRGEEGEGKGGQEVGGQEVLQVFSGVNGASALNEVSIALFLPEAAKHASGGWGGVFWLSWDFQCLTADAGASFHSSLCLY